MTESLVEEMIEEAIYSNLPDEQIIAIDGVEVEDYISTSNINIVPTFVRQMTVLYRKSTRLQPKDVDEKPKRVYEVVKPVINDEFDKQMAEIRQQMKTGSNELQTKMKDLSKGIHTVSEEKKMRDMQEKRRMTSEKATGAIEKASEEKARWKAARDAEAEREYARIEAEKHLRRKKILIDKPVTNVEAEQPAKAEPKRTIRRWKPPPPDPNANIPLFSTGPKEIKPKSAAAQAPPPQPSTSSSSKPSTPVMKKKSLELIESKKPSDCAELVGQVNRIATADVKPNIPKSEGAAATRIKNNIINNSPVVVEKSSSKRYNSRRKTQEIVNESIVKPKCKRRKLTARRKRFICADKDVDKILGYQKCTTFEQFENLFNSSSKNRREIEKKLQKEKIRRLTPSKIFISDLTDIDKIYKSSEIRDIIASVNVIY